MTNLQSRISKTSWRAVNINHDETLEIGRRRARALCLLSACHRNQAPPPGGAGDAADAGENRRRRGKADPGRDGVRCDAEIAALDHDSAADRRADHADFREVGRPCQSRGAADADRSASSAGRRLEPGGRARVERSRRRLCAATGAARRGAVQGGRHQQGRAGAGRHRAADRRGRFAGAAGAGPAAAGAAPVFHRERADRRHCRRCSRARGHAGEAPRPY